MTVLKRAAGIALWGAVLVFAAIVTRHFFQLSGSAIYLSTDDSLANLSYSLATEGRYGFLSSPILLDIPRDHGLFSYGPYYFYVGAALFWLFGYSLTLIRSIHLAVILAVALAARAWLGRVAAGGAAAIVAVGLLVTFDRAHWPMARPDSMVSAFAVALVLSAGLAMRTGRRRYGLVAGFAAACGAFTHLVAWSLIPAVVVILGIGLLADAVDDDGRWHRPRRVWGPLLATATGGLLGTFLFYASFGFRIREQVAFLIGYQKFTGSMGASTAGTSYRELIAKHFQLAYWYLPWPLGRVVQLTLVVSVVLVLAMLWGRRPRRRETLAVLAPPVVVWAGYLLSLGVYNNFHAGYAILNQVMWLWTLGAIIVVVIEQLDGWPVLRRAAEALTWSAALALAVGVLTLFAQRTEYRALADASYVPIDAYVDRVLEPLPARARSWGTVAFGIEHPGRIQLVQFTEALELLNSLLPEHRAPLAPDYVVWGFADNRYTILDVLAQSDEGPRLLSRLIPGVRYSLVSMVSASPYGVTRVYSRSDGAPGLDRPIVDLYDPRDRQWNSALGRAIAVPLTASAPARLQLGQDAAAKVYTAVQTLGGALPADTYLLRVTLASDLPPDASTIVMGTPTTSVRDAFGAFGPDFDVSPWFAGEPAVSLVYRHSGGPFYVSQFGTDHPAIASVEAFPILSLTDFKVVRRGSAPPQAMAATEWVNAYPEIRVVPAPDGTMAVAGNTTQYGYQAYGPWIPVERQQRMMLRIAVTVTSGTGCIGVLDATGMRWLVAPDRLQPQYEFQINDSNQVRPVLADCSTSPTGVVPMQASIGAGSYTLWSEQEELYVDQLMRARRDHRSPDAQPPKIRVQ